MKLLLIQPPSSSPLMDQVYMFEPLALEYLAAGAKLDGHQVEILDARIDNDIEKHLRKFTPDAVGITGFTSQLNIVRNIAAKIRETAPVAKIIVGGHHATVSPNDYNDPQFDAVVIGEGVFTLREILQALEADQPLDRIAGLALPRDGEFHQTGERPYCDLDALPLPERQLTAHYRSHYFSEWFKPLASIRTSLGCTARCNFCALWSITGGKYLRRDPNNVIAELKNIEEQNVFFCDDESMCDVRRMDQLAEMIKKAGIKKSYFLYARVDTIANHPELFDKWAKIGLKQVFVGMEDFSERRLEAMNKGVNTSQQRQAAKILDDLGVLMYASFMVDPSYTHEDFRALKAYVRQLKLKYATFTVMTPLPGTKLHKSVQGQLLSEKPELYDMLHALIPTKLPAEEFYAEMAKLYASAIPLYRVLPALSKFGLHGMLLRFKLFGKFLEKLRHAHLDFLAG